MDYGFALLGNLWDEVSHWGETNAVRKTHSEPQLIPLLY
jgi:hypothetical protein